MLPALLTQVGVPLLVRALGPALQTIPHPAAVGAVKALKAVDIAINDGVIAADMLESASRHIGLPTSSLLPPSLLMSGSGTLSGSGATAVPDSGGSGAPELGTLGCALDRMICRAIGPVLGPTVSQVLRRALPNATAAFGSQLGSRRYGFATVIAATWCLQMTAVAWMIAEQSTPSAPAIDAIVLLGTAWTIALSVLGLLVLKRPGEDPMRLPGVSADALNS